MSEEYLGDKIMEKVIDNPVTAHALLEMLIDDGVKINVDLKMLTHQDRKTILIQIIKTLRQRENQQ